MSPLDRAVSARRLRSVGPQLEKAALAWELAAKEFCPPADLEDLGPAFAARIVSLYEEMAAAARAYEELARVTAQVRQMQARLGDMGDQG